MGARGGGSVDIQKARFIFIGGEWAPPRHSHEPMMFYADQNNIKALKQASFHERAGTAGEGPRRPAH